MNNKVWFITGASKGLGLVLAQTLLSQGYKVAATSRNINSLKAAAGEHPDFLPLEVDLESEASIQKAIDQTIAAFGKIDVVVNNAGYGQAGAIEELSASEVKRNFDVNVFALLNVTRLVLPHLRAQRSGHIYNISSIAGYTGNFPAWSIYCATKFAVSGLTEGLAADVQPFGIHATIVYPGYFRTNFLAADSMGVPANPIAAYENVRASLRMHQEEVNGNQAGDPVKAAEVMIQVAALENPPLHLFLGEDAYNFANAKIESIEQDLEKYKALTVSTNIVEAIA
ncbi:oxidoreductase [Chitinophaga vietnamensis]|uniref:oxidoreductase n=1 Tax=Chitinophaga vietnamensis TaxID=2593957 RepID=UPI00117875B0|nr:oxidoreductase [Chitinophaga vietnamensis]